MIRTGTVIENPVTGERIVFRKTSRDTGGQAVVIETFVQPDGFVAAAHVHPSQEERFEVLEGAVRTVVGGMAGRYEAGETFQVPAGTPHQMSGDGPARVRWEVRPAMRTAEFFERLYAAIDAGGTDVPAVLEEFSDEIRFPGQ